MLEQTQALLHPAPRARVAQADTIVHALFRAHLFVGVGEAPEEARLKVGCERFIRHKLPL